MNVDEVPGNPVSVARPELWRVGAIDEPSWVFLGDLSITVDSEPDKQLFLEIESSESELRVTSLDTFDSEYFQVLKQEWTQNEDQD